MLTRRAMLKGTMLAGGFCLMPLGRRGWALAAPEPARRHMVVIMMRGAVDGLSIVTPYREEAYYRLRPDIALATPGNSGGLIDLDGRFGLHPSLASLMPLWQNGSLAFVQASGSPSETRSHFEAQDIMETAMLRSAMANQGWMNGLAQMLPDTRSTTRAMSFGSELPKIFQGPFNVASVPGGIKAGMKAGDPRTDALFARLYQQNGHLGQLYREGADARVAMSQDLTDDADPAMQNEMVTSAKGAPGADGFVVQSGKAGEMIRHDPSIQLVFMDVGGWDTHVGQGNAKGQLSNRLDKLGQALAALARNLGDEYRNTTILVMSEFGRTVAQNGSNGTDHGHGNVAWLLGGTVRGGKVYGQWPGLTANQLWQGRDLAVTTDFRSVIGTTIAGTFGVDPAQLKQIIPDYKPQSDLHGLIG